MRKRLALPALFVALVALNTGCQTLFKPEQNADLTQIAKAREGFTEVSGPARAFGIETDGSITYRGDGEKNITISRREWYENGQPKSEFTAAGDRSGVLDTNYSGVRGIEGQRYETGLREIQLRYDETSKMLDRIDRRIDRWEGYFTGGLLGGNPGRVNYPQLYQPTSQPGSSTGDALNQLIEAEIRRRLSAAPSP